MIDQVDENKRQEFEEMLDWAWGRGRHLTGPEEDFISDMRDKFVQYGERTRVSQAQYDWLEVITTRLETEDDD